MTEFLSENAHIRYPLTGEWPNGLSTWDGVMLDASIGQKSDGPEESLISLLSLRKVSSSSHSCELVVGKSSEDSNNLVIRLDGDTMHGRHTLFTGNNRYRMFAVINGDKLASLISALPVGDTAANMPFALRCVSTSNKRVTAMTTYSSALCETPLFTGDEIPVTEIAEGDVTISAKDGVDAESVALPEFDGNVLRVSALSAPSTYGGSDNDEDLMLVGDDCFTVETLPGMKVDESGDIVKRTEDDPGGILSGGVIKIGTKCKPCCQCEDYEQAFNSLKPANTGTLTVKDMLDVAREFYEKSVVAYEKEKSRIEEAVNSYENVRVTAAGTTSGPLYENAKEASGLRKRIAVTVTVVNMTMVNAQVTVNAADFITVPGYSSLSVAWHTAGSKRISGAELPSHTPTWDLEPGDTVVIVGTYAQAGNTNESTIPSGTKAVLTLKLPGNEPDRREVSVK